MLSGKVEEDMLMTADDSVGAMSEHSSNLLLLLDNMTELRPKSALDKDTRESIFLLRYDQCSSPVVLIIY